MRKNMITIKNLSKSFGNRRILKEINFDINEGDIACIIGPSGSGKSTFLRCINLLEYPDSGKIIYDGKKENDKYVEPPRLKIGDGKTKVNDLPFEDQRIDITYSETDGILVINWKGGDISARIYK